jgi:hypothetical protein
MKVTSNVCLIHIYLNFIPLRNKIKVKVPRLQKSDSYLALSAHFAALKLHIRRSLLNKFSVICPMPIADGETS